MALRVPTEHEHDVVRTLADRLLPPTGEFPGAGAAGAADYVDRVLGAFTTDPPAIWAGGPYSGRHGGDPDFDEFLPLSRLEELAWRTRIEGSRGIAEREWNGPVRGWQEIYRDGIAALGDDLDLDAQPELRQIALRARVRGVLRRARVRRQPRPRGVADDRIRRRRAAARLERRGGHRCLSSTSS